MSTKLNGAAVARWNSSSGVSSLVTPYAEAAFRMPNSRIGLLFGSASLCTLFMAMFTPAFLAATSPRLLLLLSSALMAPAAAALALPSEAAFVGALLLFFVAFAACQASLFSAFNERYRTHPRCGELIGFISAAGSAGRCVGPLWAVALYTARDARLDAVAAAAPVWFANGGGVALGILGVLVAWRRL